MIVVVPIILSFLLCVVTPIHGSIILRGTSNNPQTTFAFNNVLPFIADTDSNNTLLYMGRNDPTMAVGANNAVAEFALCVAAEGFDEVFPYAPYNAQVNGVENQTNPLFGQQMRLIGLYQGTPFAVTADSPQNIYWTKTQLQSFPVVVQSALGVLDATGAITSGVVAATGAQVYEKTSNNIVSGSYIFAAVAPNGGVFGAIGSGLASLMSGGASLTQLAPVIGDPAVKSSPIDGTQSYIKIVTNATIAANPVDVFFDPVVQRVYITYSATTGAAPGDGVRGIVMGYVNPVTTGTTTEFKLVLTDFVPATALVGAGNTHVGGVTNTGAPATITISKYRSLYTSTGLSYGIIVGSSSGVNADRIVSALPLVNKSVDTANTTWPTDPEQGMLASKDVAPGTNLVTYFSQSYMWKPYTGKGFQKPATTLPEIPLQTDGAVAVGGGVAPGVIQAVQTYKDTVFVATLAGATETAGIFASQALFDGNGAIKGWTRWQRVMGSGTAGASVYGFSFQPNMGKMFSMQGLTANTVDIVATSTWYAHNNDGLLGGTQADASVGFIDLVTSQFSAESGGIQAVFDFPKNTVGFAADGSTERLSVMVFTGYRQIVIVQTGADDGAGVFAPCIGNFATDQENSVTGSVVTPGAAARLISVTGGVLNDLNAITSAVITSDGVNAYLVVAGVGGVAVLRPGWPAAGLQKNFTNLPASAFAFIGSYTNVRKLLTDGTNLYVLTNNTFDRIPVTQLAGGVVTPVTLATPSILSYSYGSFSDAIVSGKLAVLATSQGLFRAGNGANVATATDSNVVGWVHVPLAESETAVTRLEPFSTTGLPQDCAGDGVGNGGQMYVLSASTSQSLSSVYRVSLADTRAAAITNTTVQVIPDYFVQATTSAYAALGAYRNYFRTDGSLFTDTRSSYIYDPIIFQAFPKLLRTGVRFYPRTATTIQLPDAINAVTVGNLVQNSGLGSLILPTGNGMQVLE